MINTWNTVYEVVSEQSALLGYKEKKVDPGLQATPNYWYDQPQTGLSKMASSAGAQSQPEEFDICWFDLAITPDQLYKIRPYQRVSQWPGIGVVAHKDKLGKNLTLMRKEFPEDYDFFPATFILPHEMNLFKSQFVKKEPKEKGPDGKGIDSVK